MQIFTKKLLLVNYAKDINENNFINLLNNIFENQNEYFSKKNNLIQLTKKILGKK